MVITKHRISDEQEQRKKALDRSRDKRRPWLTRTNLWLKRTNPLTGSDILKRYRPYGVGEYTFSEELTEALVRNGWGLFLLRFGECHGLDDSLLLILLRLNEIELKLDRIMEELRTPTAIGYSARRGNLPKEDSWLNEANLWRQRTSPGTASKRLIDISLKVIWEKQRTKHLLPPPQSEEAEF